MSVKYQKYKDSNLQWIGEVPQHWKVGAVKHCFKFKVGFTPPTSNDEFYDPENGFDWVTISDMDRKYVFDSRNKISKKAIEVYSKEIVPTGSLLYSFKLSVGKVAFAGKDIFTNEAIFSILPDDNLELSYYYYCLPSILIHNANENIYGAKIFNQEVIKNSRLPIPPKTEQVKIAQYLDHQTSIIDQLIQQKEKLIELLKEKRQAVVNETVTKGLNPKAKMKDSGIEWLGEVPEIWSVMKLKHVVEMKSGNFISAEMIEDEGHFPVYGGNGVRGYHSEYTHEGFFPLIGRQGALCGNINYANGKFWPTEHAVVVSPKKQIDIYWIGELLRIMNLNQYSQASAQPGLSVEKIINLPIPFPTLEEQTEIASQLESLNKKFDLANIELEESISKLKEYRQSIISEAVTGKIDVRDWQPNKKQVA